MKEGIVFSIEEFAIHDGPGIRTTVFLKGCPLRCQWCHNPEGISPVPEYMDKKGVRTLCGQKMTSDELAATILHNEAFFRMNSGGVTFTGGEPLMQHGFLAETLGKLDSVHKAIETSGYVSEQVFAGIIELTDLVLFDLKHMDTHRHERYTGVGNGPILRNLQQLIGSGKDFIVRIPLIPGVNDTEENMRSVAEAIKDAPSLIRIELMRYHKTAGAKYSMVGREYRPEFDTDAIPRVMPEIFAEYNLKTIIL